MRALFQLSDTQHSIYFNLFACAWFKSILQHLAFGSVRVFCLFDCQPYIFWLKIYWCCISFFVNFKVFFVVLPAWLDLKDWFFFQVKPNEWRWFFIQFDVTHIGLLTCIQRFAFYFFSLAFLTYVNTKNLFCFVSYILRVSTLTLCSAYALELIAQ